MTDQNTQATEQANPATELVNPNPFADVKEIKFGFRKNKDEETGIETKRNDVVVKLPLLSVEGIIDILRRQDVKEIEALVGAVQDAHLGFVRSVINDDTNITSENFPFDSVTWAAFANQPDSERRGRGIDKDKWEAFGKIYMEFMPSLTGKTVDQIKKQVAVMIQKFQPLRAHEKRDVLLPKFQESLAVFLNNVPGAEEYADIVEFLGKKAEQFLTQDTAADLEKNLGF